MVAFVLKNANRSDQPPGWFLFHAGWPACCLRVIVAVRAPFLDNIEPAA
jgi:hypothetical protein